VEEPEGVEISTVEELGGELSDPPAAADVRLPAGMDYGSPDVELLVPAEQELGGERAKALTDVWENEKSLQFLCGEPLENEMTEKEKERCSGGAGHTGLRTGCYCASWQREKRR
jgi:hypothetical protein